MCYSANMKKNADGETLHNLFKALHGASKAIESIEESVHQSCGLTGGQAKNLSHLILDGSMTISDLAYKRGVSRQSVQVAVSTLIDHGYVCLKDNPRHKKAKLVHVTESGLAQFFTAQETEHKILQNLFPDISIEDSEVAIHVLHIIRETISNYKE